jgi:hypothetical protein
MSTSLFVTRGVISIILAALIIPFFPYVEAHFPVPGLFLWLGVGSLLIGVFLVLALFFPFLKHHHIYTACSTAAIVISSVYFLWSGASGFSALLSWLFLVVGVIGSVAYAGKVVNDYVLISEVRNSYRSRERVNPGMPFIYVLVEDRISARFAYEFTARLSKALQNSRAPAGGSLTISERALQKVLQRPDGAKLQAKSLVMFLISDSLINYPEEMERWAIKHASATFIVVSDASKTLPDRRQRTIAALHASLGEVVAFTMRNASEPIEPMFIGDQTFEFVWSRTDPSGKEISARVAEQIVNNVTPLAVVDARLDEDNIFMAHELATRGLPPLADCYFRVRQCNSNVERFLACIDAIDCFVRIVSIVMLVDNWAQGNFVEQDTLTKNSLTLGSWVALMHKLHELRLQSRVSDDPLECLGRPTLPAQIDAMKAAASISLVLPKCERSPTVIGWFDWFQGLRDATKGHGVVDDKLTSSLWPLLHEVFLSLCTQSWRLVIAGGLGLVSPSGRQLTLCGWRRNGGQRSSSEGYIRKLPEEPVCLTLGASPAVSFQPFLLARENTILVWDGFNKTLNSARYMNYADGKRVVLPWAANMKDLPQAWRAATQGR